MTDALLPFLTIPPENVQAAPWIATMPDGKRHEDPEYLEDWDNATDLLLHRDICVDMKNVMSALQLPTGEARLELLVFAGTGAGRLPIHKWCAFRRLLDTCEGEVVVDVKASGEQLAEILHLETLIVLADEPRVRLSPLSPADPGSILWSERKRIRLEGEVSRFPVSETDLSVLLGQEWKDALWHLMVDWSNPQAGLDTAVRLHINSLRGDFSRRFREADPETLQTVLADVMVQIVRRFLEEVDDLRLALADVPGDSLMAVAMHWLDQVFASESQAREILQSDPGLFHARFNALATMPEADL